MSIYYSKLANGFFDSAIHSVLPPDAVEITAAEHAALYKGMMAGALLSGDDAGRPVLTDPAAVPTYRTLADAKLAMVGWIEGFLNQITGLVPVYERESWPTKADAARAHIAGTARPDQTAMLSAEASTSSRSVDELAAVIVARATAYETVIAQAAGLRVTLETDLEAATDPFTYETILEDGKAQAVAMADALGIKVN